MAEGWRGIADFVRRNPPRWETRPVEYRHLDQVDRWALDLLAALEDAFAGDLLITTSSDSTFGRVEFAIGVAGPPMVGAIACEVLFDDERAGRAWAIERTVEYARREWAWEADHG